MTTMMTMRMMRTMRTKHPQGEGNLERSVDFATERSAPFVAFLMINKAQASYKYFLAIVLFSDDICDAYLVSNSYLCGLGDISPENGFHRGPSAHQDPHFLVTRFRIVLGFQVIWDRFFERYFSCTGFKETLE